MESPVEQSKVIDVLDFFNGTTDSSRDFTYIGPPIVKYFTCFLLFINISSGTIGNGAVIFVSFNSETLKKQLGNLLIVYLAAIDFLTSSLCLSMALTGIAGDGWVLGDAMCKLQDFLTHTFYPATSQIMAVIAIDRLIAISYPFQYSIWMTQKVFCLCCLIVSLLSLSCGFLSIFFGWDLVKYDGAKLACIVDYQKGDINVRNTFLYIMAIGFYVPAAIIVVCYSIITAKVRRSRRLVHPMPGAVNDLHLRQIMQNNSNAKAIKSMIVVAGVYFAVFLLFIATLSYNEILQDDASPWVLLLGSCLMTCSSAVNPFIYGIFRKDYRDEFKKLFEMILRWRI